MKRSNLTPLGALLAVLIASTTQSHSQNFVSRVLTDKVQQGSGVINLLTNTTGAELTNYFKETGGLMMFGVDVNENNSGNETSKSLGIAIKQLQLSITTTTGTYSFTNALTSTTAMLREKGATAATPYYTLFGQAGSNTLTGANGFNITAFDDVMWLKNIAVTGTITRAELQVSFLDTPGAKDKPTENETFFDFSGGFEDIALLNAADATLLENARIGMANAPGTVSYATTPSVIAAIKEANSTNPGAPAPPLLCVTALVGLLLYQNKRRQ